MNVHVKEAIDDRDEMMGQTQWSPVTVHVDRRPFYLPAQYKCGRDTATRLILTAMTYFEKSCEFTHFPRFTAQEVLTHIPVT